MGLESLESGFFGTFCDTKSISIAYFYNQHLEALYSQWRSLHSTQLTPFMPD